MHVPPPVEQDGAVQRVRRPGQQLGGWDHAVVDGLFKPVHRRLPGANRCRETLVRGGTAVNSCPVRPKARSRDRGRTPSGIRPAGQSQPRVTIPLTRLGRGRRRGRGPAQSDAASGVNSAPSPGQSHTTLVCHSSAISSSASCLLVDAPPGSDESSPGVQHRPLGVPGPPVEGKMQKHRIEGRPGLVPAPRASSGRPVGRGGPQGSHISSAPTCARRLHGHPRSRRRY